MTRCFTLVACFLLMPVALSAAENAPPAVGDKAPDFELTAVDGTPVKLSDQSKEGPIVLLVMRGFPGYQCPLCRRQASAFEAKAKEFAQANARVIMVYPGDVDDLNAKALEFIGSSKLPKGFQMVLDPGYSFTNAWNLRWEGERETAYPSTFVIKDGKVTFAKVSKTHGGRTSPDEVLNEL